MNDFSKRIKELEGNLKNAKLKLKVIAEEILNFKSQERQKIQQKEKELEEWRQKLETYQQAEIKIKKEIKEKVKELEVSQLANEEKQTKINRLLTEHSHELEELDNLLDEERSSYRSTRNKLISKLCEDCAICHEKNHMTKVLEDRVTSFKILSGVLFAAATLLFILFLYVIYHHNYKRKTKKPKYLKN